MWLNENGWPETCILQIEVPAESLFMIESKSMKLYLGSFYNTKFKSKSDVLEKISKTFSNVCKAPVKVCETTHSINSFHSDYVCIDHMFEFNHKDNNTYKYMTHAFRSVCPVTSQPDYASLFFNFSAKENYLSWIKKKIVSYREVGEFHESCIESFFDDMWHECECSELSILGCFTRRGGIDINPYRSSIDLNKISYKRLLRQ